MMTKTSIVQMNEFTTTAIHIAIIHMPVVMMIKLVIMLQKREVSKDSILT